MNPHLYLADFAAGETGGRAPAYHLRLDGDSVRADGVEFDGPLELLLRMVRDGRADPLRIEISAITRQYLDALEVLEILDLGLGSGFLKMATALLRIKARRLLPAERPAAPEEEVDPLAAMEERLRDYARYRDAAAKLRKSLEVRSAVRVRPPTLPVGEEEENGAAAPHEELLEVDLFAVVEAFRRVMERARSRPQPPVPVPRIPVSVLIRRIESATPVGTRRGFEEVLEEILEGGVNRPALVAAFLAVLELARRHRISVGQERNFGRIWIEGRPAAGTGRAE